MTWPAEPPSTPRTPQWESPPPPPTPSRKTWPIVALAVFLVVALGAVLIGVSSSSSSGSVGPYVYDANKSPAQNINTHWHAALGVYDCDHWMGDASGTGI